MYITKKDRLGCWVDVNGKEIYLTLRSNKCSLENINEIQKNVDAIIDCCVMQIPLAKSDGITLSGANVLRIIETFCFAEAEAAWVRFCDKRLSEGESRYKRCIFDFLGFMPSCGRESRFKSVCEAIWIQRKAQIKEAGKKTTSAKIEGYVARAIGIANNVVTFEVNGIYVDICTSGRGGIDPDRLVSAIADTRLALNAFNQQLLGDVVSAIGYVGLQRICYAFFKDEMLQYLLNIARAEYLDKRERVYPSKIVKQVLGGNREPMALAALDFLESMLPDINQYLLDTSKMQVLTEMDTWVLYYGTKDHIDRMDCHFEWGDLNAEVREFLRSYAWNHIVADQPFVRSVNSLLGKIAPVLDIAINKLGLSINSMADLSVSDAVAIQSYIIHKTQYKIKTHRKMLIAFRQFYHFVCEQKEVYDKIDPFQYIEIPSHLDSLNPTKPLSAKNLQRFVHAISKVPEYIRLAFIIALITGARAESICKMLVSNLEVDVNNNFYLCLVYPKALRRRMDNGLPITVRHAIPAELGLWLQDYIHRTQHLRDQMDAPYVFIYTTASFRKDTKRRPSILSAQSFKAEIEKIGTTDEKCDFRTIRATVGHSLFAAGYTPAQVAAKLGNTPQVAAVSYNTMTDREKADLVHRHYEHKFDPVQKKIADRRASRLSTSNPSIPVFCGTCSSDTNCADYKNCQNCPQRIVCRK